MTKDEKVQQIISLLDEPGNLKKLMLIIINQNIGNAPEEAIDMILQGLTNGESST